MLRHSDTDGSRSVAEDIRSLRLSAYRSQPFRPIVRVRADSGYDHFSAVSGTAHYLFTGTRSAQFALHAPVPPMPSGKKRLSLRDSTGKGAQ